MEFILRPWRLEDQGDLAQAANNPAIAANLRDAFPSPYSPEDARWFIQDCLTRHGQNCLFYAIQVAGKAAGDISVAVQSDVYRKSAELGYWLAQPYWGQGIMPQAVRQICQEAFERFSILRIYAEPFAQNLASRRVLEKAGFTLEGTMVDGVFKNNQVFSYCMYALLRRQAEF